MVKCVDMSKSSASLIDRRMQLRKKPKMKPQSSSSPTYQLFKYRQSEVGLQTATVVVDSGTTT